MRLLLYEEIFCVNIIRCPMWLNNTVSRRKRYRVYLRLYLPRPLHSTSPRPRPTRPRVPASHMSRVPYQMSPRPFPRVPKSQVPTHASQCPRPLVPVPLLYTAPHAGRVGLRNSIIVNHCKHRCNHTPTFCFFFFFP